MWFKTFRGNDLKGHRVRIQFAMGEMELVGVKINWEAQLTNEIKGNVAFIS